MSPEALSGAAGVVLSLLFSYVPQLRTWYQGLNGNNKRLVMLGFLAVITVGIYGLACLGVADEFGFQASCDQNGALALAQVFFWAVVGSQATFLISPRPEPQVLPEPEYQDIASPG